MTEFEDEQSRQTCKRRIIGFWYRTLSRQPQNTPSYFVQLRTDNHTISKKWGVDLERAIKDAGVQKGDTIILNDLGKQPVNIPDPNNPAQSKTVHKNLWEIERYEPALDLPNAIEHDSEREQQKSPMADNTKQKRRNHHTKPNPKNT